MNELHLTTEAAFIPSKVPNAHILGRTEPTTQVLVHVDGWGEDAFRLWVPETVGSYWRNADHSLGIQEFEPDGDQALRWRFRVEGGVTIDARVAAEDRRVVMVVSVTNASDTPLANLDIVNCLQMAAAPGFAEDEYERIYIRVDRAWRSIASLQPSHDMPNYACTDLVQTRPHEPWRAAMVEVARPDHPLIVCVAHDGRRAVATASDNWQLLVHNHHNRHLQCIHSIARPVPRVGIGAVARFGQTAYFVDSGLDGAVAAFEADSDLRP